MPDKKIQEAGQIILHRGPDMQNFLNGKDWSIAFNRLSILDLSSEGMQPFEHDGVKVYMNGEIYNFIELRKNLAQSLNVKLIVMWR